MKPQDLMVGDWVYNAHHMKEIRMTPYDFFTHGHLNGHQFVRENAQPCLGRDLEPIPITAEILEKNGFERDFEDGSLIWVDEQDVTEIVWGGTILTIHGENGHLELDTCMYVHELQHALRLCGIDKEIVL